MKKGLFSVERVPKGIFWGETYFLDFYSITHTVFLKSMFCPFFINATWVIFEADALVINKKWVLRRENRYSGLQEG